jgi:hypothetical protein
MKRALLVASLVLVAGTVVGCGDDGSGSDASPPTNASKEDFCGVFDDMLTELGALDADAKPAEAVKALKNAADDLGDVGTPKDMPDNARDGYELILDEIEKLDDDSSREDINQLGEDISDAQEKSMAAYEKYLGEECADVLGGADPQ